MTPTQSTTIPAAYSEFWELCDAARCAIDTFSPDTAGDAMLAARHSQFVGPINVEEVTALRVASETVSDDAFVKRYTVRVRRGVK